MSDPLVFGRKPHVSRHKAHWTRPQCGAHLESATLELHIDQVVESPRREKPGLSGFRAPNNIPASRVSPNLQATGPLPQFRKTAFLQEIPPYESEKETLRDLFQQFEVDVLIFTYDRDALKNVFLSRHQVAFSEFSSGRHRREKCQSRETLRITSSKSGSWKPSMKGWSVS